MEKKIAIIAGAGVAGLTAAINLLDSTDIDPVIYEMTDVVGGISKTVNYKGNRMDIGGHRFFSKSDKVMNYWESVIPVSKPDDEESENIMLLRTRVSRIFYLNKFFDYPISLNMTTIKNLGLLRMTKIGLSYIKSMMFPIKPEESLEDFFMNRFGKELYETFFKDYTEKVWGVPCVEIKPEWGAQRIKGISIKEVIKHAVKSTLIREKKTGNAIAQKNIETSLIGQFLYPKYGVGQMWDEIGKSVVEKGGVIHYHKKIIGVSVVDNNVTKVKIKDLITEEIEDVPCDYFFSTMPISELVNGMESDIPAKVKEVGSNLKYRDFISVGVLLKDFSLGRKQGDTTKKLIPDNWIYVQDNTVKMGRIQVFNNWSPYMVKESDDIWIGLEYFCNEEDAFWTMKNEDIITFAIDELISINAITRDDYIDATVVRMPKAYPSYIGAYEKFDDVREYLDTIENMFLIGRNGMHRYNNMDHSMLTAIKSVENVKNNILGKENIWDVNAEKEYHEEKKEA